MRESRDTRKPAGDPRPLSYDDEMNNLRRRGCRRGWRLGSKLAPRVTRGLRALAHLRNWTSAAAERRSHPTADSARSEEGNRGSSPRATLNVR